MQEMKVRHTHTHTYIHPFTHTHTNIQTPSPLHTHSHRPVDVPASLAAISASFLLSAASCDSFCASHSCAVSKLRPQLYTKPLLWEEKRRGRKEEEGMGGGGDLE